MSALASLPSRAAARVRALEAGAPELAAAATCPLRPADLLRLNAAALLSPLLMPELFQLKSMEGDMTLREARIAYEGAGAAIAVLISFARRLVWRDLAACQELSAGAMESLQKVVGRTIITLGLLLGCPFHVHEGPERRTAVREASKR